MDVAQRCDVRARCNHWNCPSAADMLYYHLLVGRIELLSQGFAPVWLDPEPVTLHKKKSELVVLQVETLAVAAAAAAFALVPVLGGPGGGGSSGSADDDEDNVPMHAENSASQLLRLVGEQRTHFDVSLMRLQRVQASFDNLKVGADSSAAALRSLARTCRGARWRVPS